VNATASQSVPFEPLNRSRQIYDNDAAAGSPVMIARNLHVAFA
jgi:hypothetical protein